MAFKSHRLFLVWVMALAIAGSAVVSAARVHLSAASPVPPKPKLNATEQFLTSHNQARAAIGVGPLSWTLKLGSDASRIVRYQRDQKECGFADLGASAYGANQAWSSYPAGPAEVVASWVEEGRRYYDPANNTCAAGHECGTYTQVVWRKTGEVGCAQATCGKGATLTVCLYNPHGNVQGERPY